MDENNRNENDFSEANSNNDFEDAVFEKDGKKEEDSVEHVSVEKEFCKNCGKELTEDLKFCPNCGKPRKEAEVIRYCSGCGEKIEGDVKFCPKCGKKVATPIDINLNGVEKIKDKVVNKINFKKLAIILGGIIILIILGIFVFPKIFVSTEKLLAEGNYERAYDRAKNDEKESVLIENLVSYLCQITEDCLKDPSSFVLRDAWYENGDEKKIVLYVSGKNSLGGTTNSYWLYYYDKEDNTYMLFATINDMEHEEVESYDDNEDIIEKIINNAARDLIQNVYVEDNKLDKDLIERINDLHDDGLLKDVELLDDVEMIYPNDDEV